MEQCGEAFARRILQWGEPDYWVGVIALWNPWDEMACPHQHATEQEAKACADVESARRKNLESV